MRSSSRSHRWRRPGVLTVLAALLWAAPAAHGQVGLGDELYRPPGVGGAWPVTSTLLHIHESTLNEFAAALGTLRHSYPWNGPIPSWICDRQVTVQVSGISFDIEPTRTTVSGQAKVWYCDRSFDAALNGTADFTISPDGQYLQPNLSIDEIEPEIVGVTLPAIHVGQAIHPDPFPIGSVTVQWVGRGEDLRLPVRNATVVRVRDYYTVTTWVQVP